MRQGGVVGGIHHGNLVVFDDEMDGGELGANVVGIESVNAVFVTQ